MPKPLIVYVSGAPGAGKTTLAKRIAEQLYVPHVSSDLVHGGVRLTHGGPIDRKQSLTDAFVASMVFMAQRDISFVVDHVLKRDMSERDIIDVLKPVATIVYVHVQAKDPIARFYAREQARTDHGIVLSPAELDVRRDFHESNLPNTYEPLELGVPTITVNTDDGYEPAFDHIIEFIETSYKEA